MTVLQGMSPGHLPCSGTDYGSNQITRRVSKLSLYYTAPLPNYNPFVTGRSCCMSGPIKAY